MNLAGRAETPPSLIQAAPDKNFTLRRGPVRTIAFFRVMSRHFRVTSRYLAFFAMFSIFCVFFAIFCDFGSENGGFGRLFFDKFGLLDEKIDFVKIVLPSRRNAYFRGLGTNRCELLHEKIDTKSAVKIRCEKMR